jgi:hypothetical protein
MKQEQIKLKVEPLQQLPLIYLLEILILHKQEQAQVNKQVLQHLEGMVNF